jgi:hypothetical protein
MISNPLMTQQSGIEPMVEQTPCAESLSDRGIQVVYPVDRPNNGGASG